MLMQFAIQSIREKKFRSILAALSIAIGTGSLIVFLGLSNGIQSATFEEIEKSSPLTQITVRPKTEDRGVISYLTRSEKGQLNKEVIQKISAISGVKDVYPEIQFNNFSSLEVDIFGASLITDSMVFGVPKAFIEKDIKKPELWDTNSEPYPAIIPRKILDIYNLTVAGPQNLPALSEESLRGKELTLYPNYSTFFPINNSTNEKVKLEIVGFSDKVNLIGATLPLEVVQELNNKFANEKNDKILELFVETESADQTATIAGEIEKLGYNTAYFQKNLKDVEAKFTYLRSTLGIISLIILLTAAIAIINTFLANVAERRREIGLFRALGATKIHIKKLILFEAGIIGLIGSLAGLLISLVSSKIIDKIAIEQLASTTFKPDSIIQITPDLILFSILFGTLLSTLAAYIPAHQAAGINPVETLKR